MFDNPYIREHQARLQQQYRPSAAPKARSRSYEAIALLALAFLIGLLILT